MNRTEIYLALSLTPGLGARRIKVLVEHLGSAERVWSAKESTLRAVPGLGPQMAARIAAQRATGGWREELAAVKRAGVQLVTLEDINYPERLKTIYDPPPILYIKGSWTTGDEPAVGMVGSRQASFYGERTAKQWAGQLAAAGVTVVSGLARGIDAAAHEGALAVGGRTIAVLGCGLAHCYPPQHVELAKRIAEGGGVVLSELPFNERPHRDHFPRRNRIISGLSLGVVVVEAAQKSGALITADCAMEQGREVFAVPGNVGSVGSAGTNTLVKQGAKLVTGVEDILDSLGAVIKPAAPEVGAELSPTETQIVAQLSNQPKYLDEVIAACGLPSQDVVSLLLQLQLKQLVKHLPGQRYIRC